MEQSGEMKEVGCCLCGDVGFSDQLLPCPVCRTRSQHTYCSTMYPKIDTERWQCEWCLHKHKNLVQEQQQQQQQQQHSFSIPTVTKLKKRVRDTDKGVVAESRAFSGNNNRTSKKKKLQKSTCNNSSSPRSVVRRYKLLADVLC